jgi:LmbE family N-acetylglucosaminyl deacetylase
MNGGKYVLSIMAHPDDCEFMCAGTLALLHQHNWKIHIATMTPGDCGSVTLTRSEISTIRKKEAKKAAELLEGEYSCLECEDVFISYDKPTLLKLIQLIRKVQPQIVFTQSPSDYMVDHETTSRLTQTACFAAGIPNIEIKGAKPYFQIPALLYCDAMEGKDILGKMIQPQFIVNISNAFEQKKQMLACHESQRNWLKEHHGIDEYILSMARFAEDRGKLGKCQYGEGFRMHLGHSFPNENPLIPDLSKEVINLDK